MSENIKKQVKKEDYISLLEATEFCDYSQEYLSLRSRQGKLKAVKLGRNWVTTKEWLKEYVDSANSSKNGKHYGEGSELYSVTKNFKGYIPKIKALLPFVFAICLLVFSFSAMGKVISEDLSSVKKFVGKQAEVFVDGYEDTVLKLADSFYYKAKDISLGLASLNEVEDNVFNSTVASVKRSGRELNKDIDKVKEEVSYFLGVDIASVTKATSDTFVDYTQWLSNESKIVKASKDAIDYLFSLNRKLKEKVVSLVTLRKDISDNINDIPNKLEQEVRDIVQEEIDNQTTEPEPQQPTTVINNPIKEIQTVVTKTIFDNTYLNASLDLIWKNFAKYDQSIKNLEDLISKTSHPSAPVYISQGLQVGGNGVFDSLNAQIGSFTNLGAGQSLTVGDSSSNDSFVSNAVSTFNDIVAITANSSNPALTLTQNGSGTLLDLGSLFSVGSDGKVIITSTEVPQLQIKYDDSNYSSLVVTANGTTTLNSTGGLILDSATGEVRIASGNELYTPGGHPIRSSGEVILKEIIPIFGYEVPVQCSTSCASPSSATTTRIMTEYPFPSAMTGTTRIHKFIIKYATATTTASSTFTVRNITDSTTTTFDVPASEDTDLNKTKVYITPTVVVPTDGDDWVLDVSIPSGSTMKIYEIFLSAYDVVD
jgi:hypothetical protein